MDLTSLPDSTYCLKIAVNLSNGQTTEKRVNFNIIRNPPQANLIYASPIFYGSKTTILASMYTNQLCVIRMYYRKTGAATFNYVTLDGFASNIQFLSNQHYGFVPLNMLIKCKHEVYFEAENLTGLKTTIKNGSTNFFFIPRISNSGDIFISDALLAASRGLYSKPGQFTPTILMKL